LITKVRFILAVVNEELIIRKVKKAVILAELDKQKYTRFPKKAKKVKKKDDEENDEKDEENDEKESDKDDLANGYDYLLSMPLWSLTLEKVEALKAEKRKKEMELDTLSKITPKAMWLTDLDAFLVALVAHEAEDEQNAKLFANGKQAIKGKKKAGPRKPRFKKEIKVADDDEPSPKKDKKEKKEKKTKLTKTTDDAKLKKEKKQKVENDEDASVEAPKKKKSPKDGDKEEKAIQKKGKKKNGER